MAEIKLPEHIVSALKQIALDNNFITPEFHFSEGSDKGFIGLINRCQIKENDRVLSLMCKFLPSDKALNEKYDSYVLFERETFAYQKFLPEVEKIQLEHGFKYRDDTGFWAFPKCYHSEYNEEHRENSFIIMEDLSVDKFETKSMFESADFLHTEKIFIELAKLHAMSFVLKVKKPEVFEKFKVWNDLVCRLMTTETMKDLAPRNCQLASELFQLPEDQEIRDKVLSHKNDLWQKIKTLLEASNAEPFGVVLHGDCWINNVLFNYSKSQTIKDIRLIDWQMTRFGSAASELMYFFYCYNDKSLRDKRQADLVKIYYESLRESLKRFDLDVSEVFPFAQLNEELSKFGKFAFAMTTFAMPIICKYPEKLFADKQAKLDDAEQKALARYEWMMTNIVRDLVDMKAL